MKQTELNTAPSSSSQTEESTNTAPIRKRSRRRRLPAW